MLCRIEADHDPVSTSKMIDSIFSNGFKVVHVVRDNFDDITEFYTEAAQELGEHAPMEEDPSGEKTGSIHTHIKHPWHTTSNSYSHSDTRQPFHTDGSYESNAPQISYFFCKERAKYGGSTIFIENHILMDILSEYDSDLLKSLQSTEITFSKGSDSKTKPIIDPSLNLTWNWHRCDQSLLLNKKFNEFLEKKVFESGCYESINLKTGDALFFMDEEVLHGRHGFIGPRWLVKGGIYYERQRAFRKTE